MSIEREGVASERLKGHYLRAEDFEGLENLKILPYEGDGATSYKDTYDYQKRAYVEELGVRLPKEWFYNTKDGIEAAGDVKPKFRAMLVTTFIICGEIVNAESIRRLFGDDRKGFEHHLEGVNMRIKEKRVDRYGYRDLLPSGELVEEHRNRMNLSSNPTKTVSEEELSEIIDIVFDSLFSDY